MKSHGPSTLIADYFDYMEELKENGEFEEFMQEARENYMKDIYEDEVKKGYKKDFITYCEELMAGKLRQ